MKVYLAEKVADLVQEIESVKKARQRYQYLATFQPKDYDNEVLQALDERLAQLEGRYQAYKEGYTSAIILTSVGTIENKPIH